MLSFLHANCLWSASSPQNLTPLSHRQTPCLQEQRLLSATSTLAIVPPSDSHSPWFPLFRQISVVATTIICCQVFLLLSASFLGLPPIFAFFSKLSNEIFPSAVALLLCSWQSMNTVLIKNIGCRGQGGWVGVFIMQIYECQQWAL